jgi:hypothetical protein
MMGKNHLPNFARIYTRFGRWSNGMNFFSGTSSITYGMNVESFYSARHKLNKTERLGSLGQVLW